MVEYRKISELKLHRNNPRLIKTDKFKKLVKSIKDFPEMLEKRPLVIDEGGTILGGNQRFRACIELKLKEVPVIVAKGWTDEQKNEFVIKDNVSSGEFDFDVLANEWDVSELEDWGIELPDFKELQNENGEIQFSTELDQKSNYIVLKFSTDIDWIQAQSIFGLQSTYAKRANGKPWSKGVGRVMDGTDAILKIKEG